MADMMDFSVGKDTLERLQAYYGAKPTEHTGKSFKLALIGSPASRTWTVVGEITYDEDGEHRTEMLVTDTLSHMELLSIKRVLRQLESR